MATVVGPSASVQETNTGLVPTIKGININLEREKGEDERGGEGTGGGVKNVCHNKTSILDKKPSSFFQFIDQKILESSSLLCPVLVLESCSSLLKRLSDVLSLPSLLSFYSFTSCLENCNSLILQLPASPTARLMLLKCCL